MVLLPENNPCPYCKRNLDACTALDGIQSPKKGDVTLCFYCAEVLIFNADLSYRKPTPEELIDILAQCPEINVLHKKILGYHRDEKRGYVR